jgi:sulfur-carrier protein
MAEPAKKAQSCICEAVLPDALIRLFPEADRRLKIEARNVAELIDALNSRWPGMGTCLRDSRPSIRQHITILIDGERAQLATPIRPGATVYVLLAISGG